MERILNEWPEFTKAAVSYVENPLPSAGDIGAQSSPGCDEETRFSESIGFLAKTSDDIRIDDVQLLVDRQHESIASDSIREL